ncbi:hypothetical protein [Mesorhizobium marinum]|uniref:hypothetical protein n=1 Tax=Mesorhizobium marinum TaxID=3228790 RepID=UPI003466C576
MSLSMIVRSLAPSAISPKATALPAPPAPSTTVRPGSAAPNAARYAAMKPLWSVL